MSNFQNPNFDPAFRRQSAPLFNPLPSANTQTPIAQSNPYGGLLDYKWEAPTLNWGSSTTSGSGSGVGAASGAGTAASKPNITPGTTPGQTEDPAKTQDPTKQKKPETVSLADVGNANSIAGLIDLSSKVDRMADGITKRHLQTMISDKIGEIRRSEKWDADRAHEAKTRAHSEGVRQRQAARANPKKDLGWDGDGTATPNPQLTPSTPAPAAAAPAPTAAPAAQPANTPSLEESNKRLLGEAEALNNAVLDANSRDEAMLQTARGMLERGEITVEQYRALTGRDGAWILKAKANKAAPAAAAPAPAPAAPAPATKPVASVPPTGNRQINTTDDMIPSSNPWAPTPEPVRNHPIQVGVDAVGNVAGEAGSFINDLITMLTPSATVHQEPYVPYVPAKQGEDLQRFLPTTLRQNNPRLSNQAKLRELQSTYSTYMNNLQMAYERGSLSSDDFRDMRDAATNNYNLERDIIEGAISDAAPN